jgi:hypothetical protein
MRIVLDYLTIKQRTQQQFRHSGMKFFYACQKNLDSEIGLQNELHMTRLSEADLEENIYLGLHRGGVFGYHIANQLSTFLS